MSRLHTWPTGCTVHVLPDSVFVNASHLVMKLIKQSTRLPADEWKQVVVPDRTPTACTEYSKW